MRRTDQRLLLGRLASQVALSIAGALLFSFMAVVPVQVAAVTNPTPPAAKHETAEAVARANAKHVLALEFRAWRLGQVSASQYEADRLAFVARWGQATFAAHSINVVSGTGGAKFGSQPMTVVMDPTPSAHSLALTQYPEQSPSQFCQNGTTCYCGPSTAESILQYLHPTSYFGETLSSTSWSPTYYYGQWGLAGGFGPGSPNSWNYLETNVQGGETPWYSGGSDYPMPGSFNYWISGDVNGFPYYTHVRPASASDYEGELLADIGNTGSGYPLAADIDELVNGVHLWGHPTTIRIQHWIPLYGYGGSGAYTDYIDPVAGSALNWSVNA